MCQNKCGLLQTETAESTAEAVFGNRFGEPMAGFAHSDSHW